MRIIVVVLFFVLSPLAQADAVLYTFTAENLSGQFTLDDEALFDGGYNEYGYGWGTLSSPLHWISGTYGDYTFEGTAPHLQIIDAPADNDVTFDQWIIRSGSLSSNVINGASLVRLDLFMLTMPLVRDGFNLTPPPIRNPQEYTFYHSAGLSNGTFTTAPLQTIIRVPEPSTLLLLVSGMCAGLIFGWATAAPTPQPIHQSGAR
jgi:hypothetical protein